MNQTFVKSTRFKQVCQLLLSLIVAQAIIEKMNNFKYYSLHNWPVSMRRKEGAVFLQ